ncbi:MAG: hypothetical protein M3146_06775 [Thermoproteota archaeon]|nr:hypothetical protein [Thermoproteota archaeon]
MPLPFDYIFNFEPRVETLSPSSFLQCFLSGAIQRLPMGFLNKLRRRKDETVEKVKEQTTPQPTDPTNAPPPPGRRIKGYTSEGKPIYE